MILRTPFNIPVDAILGAFQMYSIYFIYKTNQEEQNATAYVRISLTQNITPKLGVLLLQLARQVTSHSAVIVCDQHIDLLIVLFVTSAVSNHMWRKESVLYPSNCRAAACLVHHSGNGELHCPERKERCVPAVVVTSYCVTAPPNMSYCG